MFGVVLWSDTEDRKAVIWCEDHGDLAFYKNPDTNRNVSLDAGDWVEFEMTMDRNMRFAHNPRLVAEGVFPELPQTLESSTPVQFSSAQPALPRRGTAEIIPFSPLCQDLSPRRSPAIRSRA